MTALLSWLMRQVTRLIPQRWRASVTRDLQEEADRSCRGGGWLLWHLVRIAAVFGVRRVTDQTLRISAVPQSRGVIGNIGSDVRQAMRAIRTRPWSTATIVFTLALGIGASTAVFAVFNYALFRPVPGIADEGTLVSLRIRPNLQSRSETGATFAHLVAMRDMPAFEGIAAHQPGYYPVRANGTADPRLTRVATVTKGYFQVLGAKAAAGRLFTPEEYETPGTAIAVISEHLWRSVLGGDRDAVGRTILLIDRPFTVVGVVRAFRGLTRVGDEDVWIPMGSSSAPTLREISTQRMIGRLSADTSLDAAREQAHTAFERVGVIKHGDDIFTAVVFPGLSDGIGLAQSRMRELFWMSAAASGLLLVLACANAASLLISRNMARRRDVALKGALGANRLRLFRELLIETTAIGALSAGAGLAIAAVMTEFFRTFRLASYMPPLTDVSLDWRVSVFAVAVAMITVLLAGGLPSILAARADAESGLRHLARSTARSSRIRQALTVAQVALSLALVAGAAVLGQSLVRLQSVSLGFEPNRLYSIDLRPGDVGREPARPFFDEVERRLSETPGIDAATYAQFHHIGPTSSTDVKLSPDGPGHKVVVRQVSAPYLRTLGIPLLAGRMLTAAESARPSRSGPVVLDEELARQLFGDTSPLGQTIYTTFPSLNRREVIGVAGASSTQTLREGFRASMYAAAGDLRIATLHVRSSLPRSEAIRTIRGIVREVEPRLAADDIKTVGTLIDDLSSEERLLARLALVLAGIALVLAASGIYGAMACSVHERTREFGIRMALGASRPAVGREVLRRAVTIAGLGLCGGFGLYFWVSRFLESRLFAISALDPIMLAGASALLLGAALAAAWLPTRRATRVDPTIALRAE